MKLNRSATKTRILAALAIAGLAALPLAGCGSSDSSTGPDGGGGNTTASFTVTPGAYIRYAVSGSGKITFNVTGIDMDLDKDSQPIVYFYDEKGYGGGRTTGGFQGDLRNYKLKYYNSDGSIASESYHGSRFQSSQTYAITLEWQTGAGGYVKSIINGSEFSKPGSISQNFTIGIGWPPAVRNGWTGATYTNVVWPEGAKPVQ